jgi:hypothetical protein
LECTRLELGRIKRSCLLVQQHLQPADLKGLHFGLTLQLSDAQVRRLRLPSTRSVLQILCPAKQAMPEQ